MYVKNVIILNKGVLFYFNTTMFQKFWRCYCVTQEMLIARGYVNNKIDEVKEDDVKNDDVKDEDVKNEDKNDDVKDEDNSKYETFERKIKNMCQENETPDEINQQSLDKLSYLWQHRYTGEWIYVFFVAEKIGVSLITSYVTLMDEGSVNRAILISVPQHKYGDQSILTPFAEKEIERLYTMEGKILEHFYMEDLTVNILKHDLQPKEIRVLTNDEKKQIIEKHSTQLRRFPRILTTDPLARFLGLRPHDMISCTCYSETNGEYIRYRVCYNNIYD